MTTAGPGEYRDFAMECTRMAAESATDPELRETLLGMAKLWVQAAVNCEKAIALVDDDWPTLDTGGQ